MDRVVLKFLKTEAGGGMLLALAALFAVFVANSPISESYFRALAAPVTLDVGVWRVEATLKDWIKDGLMAIFFYVIGLELKRELTVGELSNPRTVLLPVAAAIGGACVPVLLYFLLAGSLDPRGWPAPVATDIAFALAAFAILAPRADPRLRLFLLTLAVIDDLVAIVLIAALFTGDVVWQPLLAAALLLAAISWLGRRRALPLWLYPLVGAGTWALAKESGVHTSVMAVAAAMIVPPRRIDAEETIIGRLEHFVHPIAAFVVLPVFAFAAAGVSFAGLTFSQLLSGVPAAIAVALAVGKPVGVTLFAVAAVRLTGATLPFSVRDLAGVGCLCGIGFTMSLFIGALAFAGDPAAETSARLGVLVGSLLSLGFAAVVFRLRRPAEQAA